MSGDPRAGGPPAGTKVDLTNCDREPIHIPGAIQPHGVLFALDGPGLAIRRASDNAGALLGVDAAVLIGQKLDAVVDPASREGLRSALAAEDLKVVNPIPIVIGGVPFDGIAHRHDGVLILELEPPGAEAPGDTDRLVRFAVAKFREELRLRDFCQAAAREVRKITGFDRVMIYQFDHEWNGEVIAEEKREGLESFLGLHYPASDIPAQARRLYALNWVRHIADVEYRPSLILGGTPGESPLDLSHSVLRSVSPIHLEYLRNMGVAASMSISILKGEKLWGLIACHHYSPRHVPYQLRASCEFLGLVMSLQLSTKLDIEGFRCRARAQSIHAKLLNRMSGSSDYAAGLLEEEADLLDLVEASGAAIVGEGRCALIGATPGEGGVRQLAAWLRRSRTEGVFGTESLARLYPEAAAFKDTASGLLAIRIETGGQQEYVFWFRPEVVQTVNWGGDPNKVYEISEHGPRLTPRGSFALWKEEQHLKSLPWGECAIEAAGELREGIIAVALRKISELKEADRRKDEFIAMLAHELRNPLAAIHNAIQLARRSRRPEHAEWASGMIEQQVGHFTRIIDDLLDATRVAQGKIRLRKEPLDLAAAIEQAISIVRPLIAEREHQLSVTLPADPLRLEADPTRLEQVLVNLLTNAAKYTERGGRIGLHAGQAGEDAVITVRDSGVGIAPEMLPKIFDLFTQVDRSINLSQGGLGIGLTLIRKLVEMHGGSVTASSRGPGHGSEFRVRLPTIPPGGPAPSAENAADLDAPGRPLHILVVDDNVDSSRTLAAILQLSGHEVRIAHDGREAIDAALAEPPDAILLDIGLPGMDGYTVAETLRREPSLADTLIIAASGYGHEEARARSRQAGIDSHLVKPLDIGGLLILLASPRGNGASPS